MMSIDACMVHGNKDRASRGMQHWTFGLVSEQAWQAEQEYNLTKAKALST